MIPAFRKIKTLISDLQNLQNSLAVVFDAITSKQILDGLLLTNISLTGSATTSVAHGLGKEPRGWIIVGRNAASDVYEVASPTPNAILNLAASADVVVNLWVF